MQCITINDMISVPFPEGFQWSFEGNTATLHLLNKDETLHLEFFLIDHEVPDFPDTEGRQAWCHDWLIGYLRDVVGPPFDSSVAEIDGETWEGWQSVTSLGNGQFQGTRCIVAKHMPIALRISFPLRRDSSVEDLVVILENVSFENSPSESVH